MVASSVGNEEVVGMLVRAGAGLNHWDPFGHTALTLAATEGHLKVLQALIQAGEGPRVRGSTGPRVCGSTGLRVCRSTGLRVCGSAGLRVCGSVVQLV